MPYELNLEDGSSYAYLLLWNMSPIKLTTFINTWARNMNLRDSQLLKKQWHLHLHFTYSTKAKRVRGLHYDSGVVWEMRILPGWGLNPWPIARLNVCINICVNILYVKLNPWSIVRSQQIKSKSSEMGTERERGGPSIRIQLVLIPLLFLNQDHYKLEIGKAAKAGNFN